MKFKIILLAVAFIQGCSSTTYDYAHPKYGNVSKNSEPYLSERKECDKLGYGEGIEVSDRIIRTAADSAKYITDNFYSQYDLKKSENTIKAIEKEEEINAANQIAYQCMKAKGWALIE